MRAAKNKSGSSDKTGTSTAADVARLAGVSISAVSRAFTAGASVSKATRAKVMDASKVLKYRPSQGVQTPYLRSSYIIGLAVAKLDNLFFPSVVEELSDRLAKTGHRLLLFVTHGEGDLEAIHSELLRFRVDALIFASREPNFPLVNACRDFQIPVIMFGNANTNSETPSVSGANFIGGRQIADFLVAGGHKKLAYLSGRDNTSVDIEREAGFNSFLSAHDLPRSVRARADFTYDGAARAARKLLSAKARPDAIFCVNDLTAIACMEVARSEFGLRPGKDISIVGFDDVGIAKWAVFDLTTYSVPTAVMVSRTVEMLYGMLRGEQFKSVHQVILGELIIRGSARVPKHGIDVRENGVRTWTRTA